MREFKIPENIAEMYVRYAPFVARLIRKYNVYPQDFDDVLGDIWMRLVSAGGVGVLEKFKQAHTRATLTGIEAAAYLGVPWATFRVALWRGAVNNRGRRPVDGMPQPLKGSRGSRKAEYAFEDIRRLDERGYFLKPGERSYPGQPPVSRGQFEAYLTRAVRNHFANWLRTKSRKDQELRLAPLEDGSAWESHVQDESCDDPESGAERRQALQRLHQQIGPEKMTGLLELVDQGYTLTEAVGKLGVSVAVVRKVRHG